MGLQSDTTEWLSVSLSFYQFLAFGCIAVLTLIGKKKRKKENFLSSTYIAISWDSCWTPVPWAPSQVEDWRTSFSTSTSGEFYSQASLPNRLGNVQGSSLSGLNQPFQLCSLGFCPSHSYASALQNILAFNRIALVVKELLFTGCLESIIQAPSCYKTSPR